MTIDITAFEERYKRLQDELGAFNLGEALRLLAQIPVTDERWDGVFVHEINNCMELYEEHYAKFTNPVVIAIGGGTIKSTREQTIAGIGFLQGATFVFAALQEQGLTTAKVAPA